MRFAYPRCTWLAALAIWFAATPLGAAPEDALPKPIWFGQLAFSIPFKVEAGLPADQQPAQIQLYISTDRGGKWDLAQGVGPQASSFTFRAPSEGEYWFLIRTVDRQGRVTPEVGGPPELRVIVDTTPPRLELSATRGHSGEIKATWQAVDPVLNAESLKIEYQVSGGNWRAVAIDRPQVESERNTTNGTLTWWPAEAPATPAAVMVRAEIRDRAGNVTRSQAKAEVVVSPPTKLPESEPQPRGDLTAGIGTQPIPVTATPWPAQRSDDGPLNRSLSSNQQPPNQGDPGDIQPPHMARRPEWASPRKSSAGDSHRFVEGDSHRRPLEDTNFHHPIESPIYPPIRNQAPLVEERQEPPRNDRPDGTANRPARDDRTPPGNWANNPMLPRGERPRMVNSKSFEMDYEIDAVGPSGIAKVELWGTRDGGRTWSSYGVDNDNRTPIRANVEGEGLYGFRITVQSGSGLGGIAPRPGDPPEVWVAVDLTKPKVQLTEVQTGTGQHAGELLISWKAEDAAMAVRPITLLFADKPGGPWSIIAAGLENSGHYAWRPDNRAPDRIYLRIEARDEAGNTVFYESADPVPLDRVRPEGRIRSVRPIGESAGRVQIYRFYR